MNVGGSFNLEFYKIIETTILSFLMLFRNEFDFRYRIESVFQVQFNHQMHPIGSLTPAPNTKLCAFVLFVEFQI